MFEGNYDVYVAQLDPTATGFLAATYLGGSSFIDFAGGLAVNPDQPGVVYLAGATASPDFPLKNPFQARLNNSDEAPKDRVRRLYYRAQSRQRWSS